MNEGRRWLLWGRRGRCAGARAAAVGGVLVLALAAASGCRNPLFSSRSDYDRRVSLSRLRDLGSLDLSRAAAPPEPDDRGASGFDGVDEFRARLESAERVDLSIESVRAAVLEHNLNLKVQLIEPTIAAQTVSEEEGRFDAILFSSVQFVNQDDATILATESNVQSSLAVTPGLRIPLRTGGTAEVRTPFRRTDTDNAFSILNPATTTDVEFSLTQPLLRGAGRRVNTAAIRIADLSRQRAEARTKLGIIEQISLGDRAYWRLYQARQALDVRYQAYELALEQLERARREVRAGRQAEVEITRAESGVADRVEAIITAQTDVLIRQRELKRLLNIPGLGVGTASNVVTVSDPDPVRYELDGPALASLATEERADLLELELRIAAERVSEAVQRNEALPLVTANLLYRINGLGASFNESVRVTSENSFEDIEVGASAELPLGNRQRRAAVRRSLLTRLQSVATRDALRGTVRQGVLDAVDRIDNGWQRILAARQSVVLATRTARAEQRQFDLGNATSTDVLDAEVLLEEARLREIDAIVEYQIAQIDLAEATGTLLGAAKVDWVPLDPRPGVAERKRLPGVPTRERVGAS